MTSSELPAHFVQLARKIADQLHSRSVSVSDTDSFIVAVHNTPSSNTSYVLPLISAVDDFLKDPQYYDLDPEFMAIKLYEALLAKLPTAQIVQMYPTELIVANIQYGNQFTLLILKLLTLHAQNDGFDVSAELLFHVLTLYLTRPDLLISICNQIQVLFQSLPPKSTKVLNEPQFQALFRDTRATGDATLIARLLDLIVLLYPATEFDVDFDIHSDDILLDLVVINFYGDLIDKNDPTVLSAITPKLHQIFALFETRFADAEVESILVTDIINLVARLSYTFPEFDLPFLTVAKLDLESACDLQLLAKVNPEKIEGHLLEEVSEYPLFNSKYFQVLMNLCTLQTTFDFLVRKGSVTSGRIKTLPGDHKTELLKTLNRTEFGAAYLKDHLPGLADTLVEEPLTV